MPLSVITLLLVVSCQEDSPPAPIAPRPVSVVSLAETDPAARLRLTGSAKAFREEELAFEVGGRLTFIVEEGSEVAAPWGEGEADVIARLDDTRFRVKLDSANAALESARAESATLQAELDHVLPANLEAAQATTAFRAAEVKRYEEAIKTNAVSKSDLEEKRAALQVARASEKEIEAKKLATSAQIKSADARAALELENVRQATIDLEDCILTAPYPAQVARVHAIPGAVVSAGEPACSLVVMNPIIIAVSVSPQVNAKLRRGDAVRLFCDGAPDKGHGGSIFRKSTTADPSTRTYEIEIITRNFRVARDLPEEAELRALPRVNEVFFLVSISSDAEQLVERTSGAVVSPGEPWFVNERVLTGDAQSGYHAWRLKGMKMNDMATIEKPVFELEKVPVKLTDKKLDVFGLYELHEIVQDGSVSPLDVFASDVPAGVKSGDRIAYVRDEWMIRPGALISVELDTRTPASGFYVPMTAVQKIQGGTPHVFVVRKDEAGDQIAHKVEVSVTASVGALKRIEGEGLDSGSKVVLDGAHYLVDGDRVSIAREVESR